MYSIYLALQVRVFNNYNLSSHWSQVQVLSLDDKCGSVNVNTATQGSLVSVYYENKGIEKSKVLEFGCDPRSSLYSVNLNSFAIRIQDINDR